MTVVMTSVIEWREGKPYAQIYCYTAAERGDEERVRDVNHAVEIARGIVGDGPHLKSGVPTKGLARLFDIYINVTHTRRGTAQYRADYRRYFGCPVRVAGEMMEIYREIKKVLRGARDSLRERRAAQENKKG